MKNRHSNLLKCLIRRIYRHLCATYESASTRRFLLGRVDCIRAETPEALKWVSAMQADFPQAHSDTQRTRPQIPVSNLKK